MKEGDLQHFGEMPQGMKGQGAAGLLVGRGFGGWIGVVEGEADAGDGIGFDGDGASLRGETGAHGGERVGSGWEIAKAEAAVRAGEREEGIGNDIDPGVHGGVAGRGDGDHELRVRKGVDPTGFSGLEGQVERGIAGDARRNAEVDGKGIAVGEIDGLVGQGAENLGMKTALDLGEDRLLVRCGEGAVVEAGRDPEEDGRLRAGAHAVLVYQVGILPAWRALGGLDGFC